MQRNKITKLLKGLFFTAIIVVQIFTVSSAVFAADDYVPLTTIPGATVACVPGPGGDTSKCKTADPTDIIQKIYSISIGIAAILAVIMIIFGGIQYATTEAMVGKSDAKDHIKSALFGLILLVGSYLILKTINSQLVNINLDLGTPVKATGEGGLVAGGDVFSAMLSNLEKNVSEKTAVIRATEEGIKKTQSEIDILNDRIKERDAQLAKITDKNSKEAKALEEATQTDIKERAAKEVKIAQDVAKKITDLVETTGLKGLGEIVKIQDQEKLDIGGQAAIQGIKSTTLEAQQRLIDKAKADNLPAETIKGLEANLIATTGLIKQQEYVSTQLRKIETLPPISISETGNVIIPPNYAGKINQARQELISQFGTTAREVRAKDPNQSNSFQEESTKQLSAFDTKAATIMGCANGIVANPGGVSCKP